MIKPETIARLQLALGLAFLLSFVFFCIWGLLGGMLGFLGARIATRHHPYYTEMAA